MNLNPLIDVVDTLGAEIKKRGYRKNRLSWYKIKDGLTVVFAIQKSQYSMDTWFYSFGICIHEIATGSKITIDGCQIKYRIDNVINEKSVPIESIVLLLGRWESMYGDLHHLQVCAVQGNLPKQSTLKAIRYLSSVDLSAL